MNILGGIRNRVYEIRHRLTHVGKTEPLSVVSLIFIGLLDLFVFSTIQSGAFSQVEQLTSPDEYIPYGCRSIVIEDSWVEDNYIGKISNYVLGKSYSGVYLKDRRQMHPICLSIKEKLDKANGNKSLASMFKERQKLTWKYDAYDLYQKQTFPEAKEILLTIRNLDKKISAFNEVKEVRSAIERSRTKAAKLAEDERRARFIYPLQRFGMQMMFLLPLFLLFYLWNAASIKKERSIQALLSAHMLVVTFIPIIFQLGELLLDIIPKRFLEKLMEILASLNLVGLWAYFVIAIAIVSTLLIIYVIQKKLFSREKLIVKRISKGQCIECGVKMPSGVQFCPYCGCEQVEECSSCHQLRVKGSLYCSSCGAGGGT